MAIEVVKRPSGNSNGKSVIVTSCPFCGKDMDNKKYSMHIRNECKGVEWMYR